MGVTSSLGWIRVAMCAAALGGCVNVPPLVPIAGSEPDPNNTNPKSISINDVVVRVKCELRDSIASRTGPDYDWMNKWTAQADLTLAVNDQSAIAPGAVFTQPLTTESLPMRVTNMARSASLGVGASASTTAARTEIVSFSVSLKEIRDEFKNKTPAEVDEKCHPHNMVGLNSDLGLKEWFDSALGPVQNHLLTPGHHSAPKGPGGGGGAAGGAAAKPQKLTVTTFNTLEVLARGLNKDDTLRAQLYVVYDEYELLGELSAMLQGVQAGMNKNSAWDSGDFQLHLGNFSSLQQTFQIQDLAPDALNRLAKLGDAKAIEKIFGNLPAAPSKAQLGALMTAVSNDLMQIQRAMLNDITPAVTQLELICDCNPPKKDSTNTVDADTLKRYSDALKCLNTMVGLLKANLPPAPAPLDPPIDAISHQVQFIVVLSASANPSWSLLHFKGPTATSGNFASLNGTNTDTLTITIGVPGSQATVNSRGALTLSTALANQLIPAQQANPGALIFP